MDVQVKLWLQGGHIWEFCCDEDDPIIFGLVSALPGADLGGNLPADGLIQVETRSGERLYIARSSIVSVDILPVVDELQFLDSRRLATASPRSNEGLLTPSAFAMAQDALPGEMHRALIGHAIAQDATLSTPTQDTAHELKLGPLVGPLTKELRSIMLKSCTAIGLPQTSEIDLQLQLYSLADGTAAGWEANSETSLIMVYHCFNQPKEFSGGGVRLFDSKPDWTNSLGRSFRDIELEDNCAIVFDGESTSAGLPIQCRPNAANGRLFVLLGLARKANTEPAVLKA